jgi:hypothetical protein
MIKLYLNSDGSIAKYKPVQHKEVIVDFDINDHIVVDEDTKEIVKYENSKQFSNRLYELSKESDLNEFEKNELEYLQKLNRRQNETQEEKLQDLKESQQYEAIINVTTEGRKKKYTLITKKDPNFSQVEFDEER